MRDLLQYLGSALSIGGAILLALNISSSRHAWKLWMAANVVLAVWGAQVQAWGIVLMQAVFCATSLMGMLRHRKPSRSGSLSGSSDALS